MVLPRRMDVMNSGKGASFSGEIVVWALTNKSDISYLKSAGPSNILIHSRALLTAILSWLAALWAS